MTGSLERDDSSANAPGEPILMQYLRAMVRLGTSDLHFKVGAPPHMRLRSRILAVKSVPLSAEYIEAMVEELLDDGQRARLSEAGSVDLVRDIAGSDRFRINVYRQRSALSVAVRRVVRQIPTFAQLHLPVEVRGVANSTRGLVLVAGVSGSGMSTTIAAMLNHINHTRACRIMTIEDPIEFVYTDNQAVVEQREVGVDVPDFRSAIRGVMREDSDVIMIGEMRDMDTVSAALRAAETGHLVFGTVHAPSATATLTRLLNLFPGGDQPLLRQSLAMNLCAILCQRLLPCLDKRIGRLPAVELMLANPSIKQAIADGRDDDILNMIRSNRAAGMLDMTDGLLELVQKELVDPAAACEVAHSSDELKMRLKGITPPRARRYKYRQT